MKRLYNISQGINQSIEQCLDAGDGEIIVNDNTIVQSTWEEWDKDSNYDMVTIYIYEDGAIKFRYQVEETKMDAYIPF